MRSQSPSFAGLHTAGAAVLLLFLFAAAYVPAFAQEDRRPTVTRASRFDISPPLRSIPEVPAKQKAKDDRGANGPVGNTHHDPDPAAQTQIGLGRLGPEAAPPLGVSFPGISNPTGCNGCSPPDPNGDIGPNHYVQMVNLKFQIFNRTGTSLFGPVNTNTLWAGFGGPCQTENAGDPVVLYDQLADRWLLSQFTDSSGPFFNCVAISTTPDPTGTYYRYAFSAPTFPDYPKYGVWPDGYYMNTRESGVVGFYALDRVAMLAGNPAATSIRFQITQPASGPNGLLPADLDGSTLPPAGSPNYFVGTADNNAGAAADALIFYKFFANFATPASSTFIGPLLVPVDPFDSIFPCSGGSTPSRNCIPQPGTATKIDILSYRQRPTFRLAYRNFGTHESLVTSQSVEGSTGMAGMRWYEIRDPAAVLPTVYQQGTFVPGTTDGIHRWMGSIAQDRQGNIGLGYSVSNAADVFPGIRYTGRLVSDPLGTMPQGEGIIVNGGGSQTSTGSRWGDYSSMNIDPTDDCTFWYTNQYYASTSSANWATMIASFKFPGCTSATGVGFESDVTPRFSGGGTIDTTDVIQLRRFATGLDTPNASFNEGQRADCAPRSPNNGDGAITSADVIQARRYATGLDPLTGAGGPSVSTAGIDDMVSVFGDMRSYIQGREMRVVPGATSSSTVRMAVEMTPRGDEQAASFTLEYDASKLANPKVTLAEGAPRGAVLTVNTNSLGRVGVLVDAAETFAASAAGRKFVVVTFDVVPGARGESPISLTNTLAARSVSDAFGNGLAVRYVDSSVKLASVGNTEE